MRGVWAMSWGGTQAERSTPPAAGGGTPLSEGGRGCAAKKTDFATAIVITRLQSTETETM